MSHLTITLYNVALSLQPTQFTSLIVNLVQRIYQDTIFVSPSSHHPTDLHIVVPHHNSDGRMTINILQEMLKYLKQRPKSCPQKENELSLEQYLNENAVLLISLQPMQTPITRGPLTSDLDLLLQLHTNSILLSPPTELDFIRFVQRLKSNQPDKTLLKILGKATLHLSKLNTRAFRRDCQISPL